MDDVWGSDVRDLELIQADPGVQVVASHPLGDLVAVVEVEWRPDGGPGVLLLNKIFNRHKLAHRFPHVQAVLNALPTGPMAAGHDLLKSGHHEGVAYLPKEDSAGAHEAAVGRGTGSETDRPAMPGEKVNAGILGLRETTQVGEMLYHVVATLPVGADDEDHGLAISEPFGVQRVKEAVLIASLSNEFVIASRPVLSHPRLL